MSTIRLLAEEIQLSRVTVSAALRGLPWVKLTTRDRVLRRAEQRGVALATKADATTGILGIVRIKGHAQRGRAAVERQRAIGRAARGAAYEERDGGARFGSLRLTAAKERNALVGTILSFYEGLHAE